MGLWPRDSRPNWFWFTHRVGLLSEICLESRAGPRASPPRVIHALKPDVGHLPSFSAYLTPKSHNCCHLVDLFESSLDYYRWWGTVRSLWSVNPQRESLHIPTSSLCNALSRRRANKVADMLFRRNLLLDVSIRVTGEITILIVGKL